MTIDGVHRKDEGLIDSMGHVKVYIPYPSRAESGSSTATRGAQLLRITTDLFLFVISLRSHPSRHRAHPIPLLESELFCTYIEYSLKVLRSFYLMKERLQVSYR